MKLAIAAAVLAGCGEGVSPPEIRAVVPTVAQRGAVVDLDGVRFCEEGDVDPCAPFAGSVAFGIEIPQIRAVPVAWDPQNIRVTVPQSVADGPTHIIVTVDGRSSNAVGFTVTP